MKYFGKVKKSTSADQNINYNKTSMTYHNAYHNKDKRVNNLQKHARIFL